MANVYNRAKFQMLNWLAGLDHRVLLVDDAYVYSPDHNVVNDVVVDEINVTNYTRQTLSSETATENDTADRGELDAADATFTSLGAGATIGGAVDFIFVTTDADSWLVAFIDTNNLGTAGNNVTLQFGTTGFVHALEN